MVTDATIRSAVVQALAEDVGAGDITTASTVAKGTTARALITQRAPGVIFGLAVAEQAFRQLDDTVQLVRLVEEGTWREEGPVLRIEGCARAILTAERTALNFLQRLSGVATLAARCVRAVDGSHAQILDTRKTTPGLRALEKAAVVVGGATNHRAGLYDAILIKENHAALAGGVAEAVRKARAHAPGMPLEVECSSLPEVDQALAAQAPRILLDNMDVDQLRAAVRHVAGRAELEASGGFTVDTIKAVAATGVDFISVGAMTHSAPALDLSLLLTPLS